MTATTCPDENQLSAWAFGACSVDEARSYSSHTEECKSCHEAFVALVRNQAFDTTLVSSNAAGLLTEPLPVPLGEVLLGKYQVESVLGSGGMGVVLRARHLQLNTPIALKFIRAELARDADVVARFAREARAAARLKTAHVCQVLDLGVLPSGLPFMVMEYLEGETIDARLAREGPQPPHVAVGWIREMLSGLAEAHQAGIVHRDLKPANLFLQREPGSPERLKILDFGIAKSVHPDIEEGLSQTSARFIVGTPTWMSPEQLTTGAQVDARTDIWAAGCALYAMLAGKPPFSGGDFVQLAWQVRNAKMPSLPAEVPPALAAVVARCLEKDPSARFASAAAMREAIDALPNVSPAVVTRPVRWKVVAAAVAIAIAAGAAGLASLMSSPVAVAQPAAAAPSKSKPEPLVPPAPAPQLEPPDSPEQALNERPLPVAVAAPMATARSAPRPAKIENHTVSPTSRDAGVMGDDVFGDRL